MYQSTKNYGNDRGLSCCFRQHRATHSHCSLLHGYSLGFKFVFEAATLDDKNWVVDFGGLKGLLAKLKENFDHTLAVAMDDPQFPEIVKLGELGVANVKVFRRVGCEAFAEFAWNLANDLLVAQGLDERARVVSCECYEHGSNSAIYIPEAK